MNDDPRSIPALREVRTQLLNAAAAGGRRAPRPARRLALAAVVVAALGVGGVLFVRSLDDAADVPDVATEGRSPSTSVAASASDLVADSTASDVVVDGWSFVPRVETGLPQALEPGPCEAASLGSDLYLGVVESPGQVGLYRSSNGGVRWARHGDLPGSCLLVETDLGLANVVIDREGPEYVVESTDGVAWSSPTVTFPDGLLADQAWVDGQWLASVPDVTRNYEVRQLVGGLWITLGFHGGSIEDVGPAWWVLNGGLDGARIHELDPTTGWRELPIDANVADVVATGGGVVVGVVADADGGPEEIVRFSDVETSDVVVDVVHEADVIEDNFFALGSTSSHVIVVTAGALLTTADGTEFVAQPAHTGPATRVIYDDAERVIVSTQEGLWIYTEPDVSPVEADAQPVSEPPRPETVCPQVPAPAYALRPAPGSQGRGWPGSSR